MVEDQRSNTPGTFTHAIVRQPSPDLGGGLTTVDLGAPDPDLARRQFERYVAALEACGLTVEVLPPLEGYPDAHFVEDAAVVTRKVAIVTRPGAAARLGEEAAMEPVVARHRPVARIEAPGTVDGGDVLMVGDRFLVGLSARTNREGARQFGAILEDHGLTWRTVPVRDGLHLRASANLIDEDTLLVTESFAPLEALAEYRKIVVRHEEQYACNALLMNGRVIIPSGYPDTRRQLTALGREIIELDTSEFRKMDGGLTCLSLRF